ncbi:Uncharacterised protein [Vibrio cholerae]|nr:Uncharacterised protein [Vibrio cholerae]CSD00680.1 Uncharacterised protein [Vibrio cholerae]
MQLLIFQTCNAAINRANPPVPGTILLRQRHHLFLKRYKQRLEAFFSIDPNTLICCHDKFLIQTDGNIVNSLIAPNRQFHG